TASRGRLGLYLSGTFQSEASPANRLSPLISGLYTIPKGQTGSEKKEQVCECVSPRINVCVYVCVCVCVCLLKQACEMTGLIKAVSIGIADIYHGSYRET